MGGGGGGGGWSYNGRAIGQSDAATRAVQSEKPLENKSVLAILTFLIEREEEGGGGGGGG